MWLLALCFDLVTPTSLAAANESARPGDVLVLQGGTYRTPIRPARSGQDGKPIVYRADAGGRPVFTGLEVAIDLRQRSHVTLEGIAVEKVDRFLWADESSHLTFSKCTFDTATAWESCRLKRMGDFLRVTDCVFRNGSDLLSIQGGSHHLVENCTFDTASHTCLVLMGVERSVVRGNTFRNPDQKLMEIFTTREHDWKGEPRLSQFLVIEGNRFDLAAGKDGHSGIQYAGNRSILRRNVFRACGTGIEFTAYKSDPPEAHHNVSNRFYNNTVVACGGDGKHDTGVTLAPAMPDFSDQVFVNNIIAGNRGGDGRPTVQVALGWDAVPAHAIFLANDIVAGKPGEEVFWWGDAKGKKTFTLKEFEAAWPKNAARNIEAAPRFVDAEKCDFRLAAGCACIDAGMPLSVATDAGEGKVIRVDDALFFSDGNSVADGDAIRVGAELVHIVAVDAEARRLTVDRAISWKAGALVTLDFAGKAPDIGAYESR